MKYASVEERRSEVGGSEETEGSFQMNRGVNGNKMQRKRELILNVANEQRANINFCSGQRRDFRWTLCQDDLDSDIC